MPGWSHGFPHLGRCLWIMNFHQSKPELHDDPLSSCKISKWMYGSMAFKWIKIFCWSNYCVGVVFSWPPCRPICAAVDKNVPACGARGSVRTVYLFHLRHPTPWWQRSWPLVCATKFTAAAVTCHPQSARERRIDAYSICASTNNCQPPWEFLQQDMQPSGLSGQQEGMDLNATFDWANIR